MKIIEELQECVSEKNSIFLKKLADRWYTLREEPQAAFLDLLAEEIRERLPNYRMAISLRFQRMIAPSPRKPEELLEKPRQVIRKTVCDQGYYDQVCESERCFEGTHSKGVEIGALVIRNGDFCLMEYQDGRKRVCYDVMKTYWMHQFFNLRFESLFVTSLTTRKHEDTFDRFNQRIISAKSILDSFLNDWKMLEIVDLFSEKRRRLNWIP